MSLLLVELDFAIGSGDKHQLTIVYVSCQGGERMFRKTLLFVSLFMARSMIRHEYFV